MIDLSTHIRTLILSDPLSGNLPEFNGTKAVFTRSPVPTDAPYPMIIVSPQITHVETDVVNATIRRLTYDIAVYGQNDAAENYRMVEMIAFDLISLFKRLSGTDMTMPTGWGLINATGIGPIIAPVNDNDTVGRIISVTFTVQQ